MLDFLNGIKDPKDGEAEVLGLSRLIEDYRLSKKCKTKHISRFISNERYTENSKVIGFDLNDQTYCANEIREADEI